MSSSKSQNTLDTELNLFSPEIYFDDLLAQLFDLKGTLVALNNTSELYHDLNDRLLRLIREVKVSKVLYDCPVIAIAGSQGAGKTTFIKNLYSIDGWFDGNEGLGEHLPVIIMEKAGITVPTAEVLSLKADSQAEKTVCITEAREITKDEFKDIVFDNPRPENILTKLYIPIDNANAIFKNSDANIGFLLLPGYEEIDQFNKSEQEFMRHSLILSCAQIVVVDQSRLADNRQIKIAKDLYNECLQYNEPIIVVSKTENANDKLRNELKNRAREVFKLKEDNEPICSGKINISEWRNECINKLMMLNLLLPSSRSNTLRLLNRTMTTLSDLLKDIKKEVQIIAVDDDKSAEFSKYTNIFDKSVKSLRKKFIKGLKGSLDEYATKCTDSCVDDYIDKEEGFVNCFICKPLNWLQTTSGEREREYLNRINKGWSGVDGQGFLPGYRNMLYNLLKDEFIGFETNWEVKRKTDKQKNYDVEFLNEKISNQMREFLYPEGKINVDSDLFKQAIQLLPFIMLEFHRIITEIIPTLKIGDIHKIDDLVQMSKDTSDNFAMLSKNASNIIKTIAAVILVDGAVDGKIDTIPALITALGGAGAASNPYVLAGAAVVAISLLCICLIDIQQKRDAQHRSFIRCSISELRNQQEMNAIEAFDFMMEKLGDYFNNGLEKAYGTTLSMTKLFNLEKCIASVEKKEYVLSYHLNRMPELI